MAPSLISVIRSRSRKPRSRRCCTAVRMFCSDDTGVQEPLDDLQDDDVPEAVEPLGARSVGRTHAGLDQAGTRPVVELAVGDARRRAGGRAPVSDRVGTRVGRTAVKRVRPAFPGLRPGSAPCRTVAADSHADPPSLTCPLDGRQSLGVRQRSPHSARRVIITLRVVSRVSLPGKAARMRPNRSA